MDQSSYTGIGISCGGGLCNVCLAYLSVPVMSFSIPRAGDYIDTSAASVTGERINRIRLEKEESFHFNGFSPGKLHQVLSVYYDEMIHSLVAGMKQAIAGTRNMPKMGKPIPIVLSGGTAMPDGFKERFEAVLKESDFQLPISEIRMSADPLHTSAKGALVAALTDM
jgi:tRNA A37 threonylcarbamoyltransferase TsaD